VLKTATILDFAKIQLGARTQGLVAVLKVQRSCQQTSGGRGHPKQRRSPKMEEFPYVSIIFGIYGHMIHPKYAKMERTATRVGALPRNL
jgi:hypothetical protein